MTALDIRVVLSSQPTTRIRIKYQQQQQRYLQSECTEIEIDQAETIKECAVLQAHTKCERN